MKPGLYCTVLSVYLRFQYLLFDDLLMNCLNMQSSLNWWFVFFGWVGHWPVLLKLIISCSKSGTNLPVGVRSATTVWQKQLCIEFHGISTVLVMLIILCVSVLIYPTSAMLICYECLLLFLSGWSFLSKSSPSQSM